MISLTKLIIGILIFAFIFILIISGKARALCSALLNLFIEDRAATPEGAEALFNQKEERVEESFRRADAVYKKVSGQNIRCKNELEELEHSLKNIEATCENLAKHGDDEGLDIKIAERSDVIDEIELHKKTLIDLISAVKAAKEARDACEQDLIQIKKQKKRIVSEMKRNRDMQEVYNDLEGIGANDHTTRLLDKVIEKSKDMDDMVLGSKEAYETKTSTKVRQVEKRIRSSEVNDYKQQLLSKYKNK